MNQYPVKHIFPMKPLQAFRLRRPGNWMLWLTDMKEMLS